MGGTSREREVSLRSGRRVAQAAINLGYEVLEVDIKEISPQSWLNKVLSYHPDVIFLALHGSKGEDGTIQGLLEMYGIPYTGSGILASALAMDKVTSKRIFIGLNIPTPNFLQLNSKKSLASQLKEIEERLTFPVILKPRNEGSSIGVKIISQKEELKDSVEELLADFKEGLVEEYIKGKTVTVGILGDEMNLEVLPILELIPKREFYDYIAKYNPGMTEFVIPARLEPDLYKYTEEVSKAAFLALGCYSFARVDLIVDEENKIPYVTEVNTIPGMTDLSDLPAMAEYKNISFESLVDRIIKDALKR
jgi:D-alanine-D-alanine ligase